ncbi:MAG TPA: hypothetical protein VFK40_13040 [Nitrososphaeraceae archaeon]|nr:hypothetical protein [Nitrososphaeraceae archaeon]
MKYVLEHNGGIAFGIYGLIIDVYLLMGNVTFGFSWDNYDVSIALLYNLNLSIFAIISLPS